MVFHRSSDTFGIIDDIVGIISLKCVQFNSECSDSFFVCLSSIWRNLLKLDDLTCVNFILSESVAGLKYKSPLSIGMELFHQFYLSLDVFHFIELWTY